MPELPDVEAIKRYMDATSLGQEIGRVQTLDTGILQDISPQALQCRLKDSAFTGTRRHGKHLFARLRDDGHLAMHFGMTGRLEHAEGGEEFPRYTRAVIHFQNGGWLAYVSRRKIGRVSYADDPDKFLGERRVGPDVLEMDQEAFMRALKGRRGTIKAMLMDQQLFAGIGNVYADEILFQAGVAPQSPADALEEKARGGIFRQAKCVLQKAIDCGADRRRMPAGYLLPRRGEKGAECPRCGGKLKQTKISGRTTYHCPRCQKEPAGRRKG